MIGPLRMINVSPPGVLPLCSTAYFGSAIASMVATRIGMYSGRQPAITPLTATLHTVAARRSGSSTPRTSSGLRSVKRRNSSIASLVGGTIGRPSEYSCLTKYLFTALKPPRTTMSRAPGSPLVPLAAGITVRFWITCSAVTPMTSRRSSSLLLVPMWPGTMASVMFGMPRPIEVAAACFIKPSHVSEEVG